jgi:hypothetical protein
MYMSLSKEIKIVSLNSSAGSSQGTTGFVCANVVDRSGFDSVCLIATLGTVANTAAAVLVPNFGDTSGTMVASSGTTSVCAGFASCTTECNNALLVLDMHEPMKRWIGASVVKGTAATAVLAVTALLYNRDNYAIPYTNLVAGSSGTGAYLPCAVSWSQATT